MGTWRLRGVSEDIQAPSRGFYGASGEFQKVPREFRVSGTLQGVSEGSKGVPEGLSQDAFQKIQEATGDLRGVSRRYQEVPRGVPGDLRGISGALMRFQGHLRGSHGVSGVSRGAQGRFKGSPRGLRGLYVVSELYWNALKYL